MTLSRRSPSPPRHVLLVYMTRALAGHILLCAFVLVALMEILGLLEQTTPILARHLGLRGVATYALLHLPAIVLRALPLSVLIGAIALLTRLTLGSEIASLRAAGLTTGALYLLLLPAVLGTAATGLFLHEVLAPRSELALARWWNASAPHPESISPDLWFHDGDAIVHITGFGASGRILYGVNIYQRARGGVLHASDRAATARWSQDRREGPGQWEGRDMRRLVLTRDQVIASAVPSSPLPLPNVTPDEVLILAQPYPQMSTTQVRAVLHGGAPASLPKATYRMALFAPYIMPLNLSVMLLLALPVVYIPPRTGSRSMMPVAALGAGFAYIVLQGIVQALGNAGTLPAPLAILATPLMAVLLGMTWVLKMEES
ncbi:LptF/LptG family permease [Acidomonas methanolica]|uniref:Transporter YjgP/YjgQ n=1 Tax=Acidomonas methanolica NBRC 104435 TaxID=1231351 RepID=A0A023D2Z6_ACIMT|nr:LptF/LptG family permease [Acidomonas methanolica]MBU2654515.1 LptF/LptG family permease [Acidomonas methanolica]TCS28318.1 lipopolysaccharide export system permease protein [Acidomonas methanolica]GAJ28548.1 transporter YjgP/YjgQ [Acidomonas methanolica NBRC 104435]GBQ51356.1 transporter YjgP/YjgQ [Acidomonas methanolica]GEK99035.1 hypothetical protein AME01nite_15340 [Acidomonas methanolica NBRC 104435]